MGAYVRATSDGSHGTRLHLHNPSQVTQRVVIQVFDVGGEVVASEELFTAFEPGKSKHIELDDFLDSHGVTLPFEGHAWVGTTPASGKLFMGLQGIVFDWYGPAHLASYHGMRDFGNPNGDLVWSDLILPRVTNTSRYVTRVVIFNTTGDGVAEALVATPRVTIRGDDGQVLVDTTLPELAPYALAIFDVSDLEGGDAVTTGSAQIREDSAGLVAGAFLVDRENDGFVSADHFFDRHFVVHERGFIG